MVTVRVGVISLLICILIYYAERLFFLINFIKTIGFYIKRLDSFITVSAVDS